MSRVEEILKACISDAAAPARTIAVEKARTGKQVVGCMLEFCPEELVYAAGMLPVGLWGGDVELSSAKSYYPAFFCAPIQQSFELAMKGAYDGLLSAVIVPILCDALKSAGQNWRIAVPQIPMIPLVYPQNRHITAGQKFLARELADVRTRLESVCGHPVSDEKIREAIDIYNEYRRAMQDFVQEAPKHADVITSVVRHSVFACGFLRDKKDYTQTIRELVRELKQLPEVKPVHSVAVTGIALDYEKLLQGLDDNALTITADTLAQESGQIDTLVPEDPDPLMSLSRWWIDVRYSSLAVDEKKARADRMIQLVKSGKAEGVLVAAPSFCDPEEYDYPILHSAFKSEEIPELYIELNDRNSCEKTCSRIQAFAELLG